MSRKLLVTGARIVNEERIFEGDLFIEDGRITKISLSPSPLSPRGGAKEWKIINARGKYLIPGIIDEHVHLREPGLTHKADIYSETKAAVAGGVTSFMDMPNTVPNATTLEILEEKFQLASERSFANYSFYLGATDDNLDEIEKADPSKICGLKLFMGQSTGNMMVGKQDSLERIFASSPLLVAVHAEDESVIRENLRLYREKHGEDIPFDAHPIIRDEKSCFAASEKAVNLALKHNSRLHLLHLSTAKELLLLDNKLPLEKKKITGEACVHHLWFDDRNYPELGSRIKWNPAIKQESDKVELLQAVLDNRIDTIATDHAPHMSLEKQNPYLTCPSGAPLLQHSLVVMLELYKRGKISLEKIVQKMCHGPAILYGIKERGFIRNGYFADLVLVDPDASWEVNSSNLLYKCGWSPLEGQKFSCKVTHTIINGEMVYNNGKFNEDFRGERLVFRT